MICLINKTDSLADQGEEPVNEKGEKQGRDSMMKNIDCARVIGLNHSDKVEDTNSNSTSHYASDKLFQSSSVDPVQAINIGNAVGSAETHTDYKQEDRCVVVCLIKSDPVLRMSVELFDTIAFLMSGVVKPYLRADPFIALLVIVNEQRNHNTETEEEQVEFVLS